MAAAQEALAPTLNYGLFIQNIVDFLIIAFAIFIAVKQINKMKRKEEEVEPEVTTKECPYCITEIPLAASRCPHCTSVLEE